MINSNEVLKCLYERGSVRGFEDKDISSELMKVVLDAGCHAATGGNLQPYSIIEIRSDEQKDALMETGCMQSIVKNAPVSLLFCIDWHRIERWAKLNKAPYSVLEGHKHFWISFQDTIIAAQNICTAADAVGLGSVYLGTVLDIFDDLKPMFKLPEGVFPVVMLSLGYPTKKPQIAPKLLSDIIVHKEVYTEISNVALNRAMDKKYGSKSKTTASEGKLKELHKVSSVVEGEAFADQAVNYAKDLGYIHEAQRYFGLHYKANWSRSGNKEFLDSLRNYGFKWVDGRVYDFEE